MAKKRSKADQAGASPEQTTETTGGPVSFAFVSTSTKGLMLDQARGIPICLENWTSFAEEPGNASTSITIQKWTGHRWKIIDVIGFPGHAEAMPLDHRTFPGKYRDQLVLAVFKPAEKTDK